jgi:elongation factor Tu
MSAFARSIAPFLRTGRTALRRPTASNPLLEALGRGQNAALIVNACRGMAVAFERKKPHVNIGEQPTLLPARRTS